MAIKAVNSFGIGIGIARGPGPAPRIGIAPAPRTHIGIGLCFIGFMVNLFSKKHYWRSFHHHNNNNNNNNIIETIDKHFYNTNYENYDRRNYHKQHSETEQNPFEVHTKGEVLGAIDGMIAIEKNDTEKVGNVLNVGKEMGIVMALGKHKTYVAMIGKESVKTGHIVEGKCETLTMKITIKNHENGYKDTVIVDVLGNEIQQQQQQQQQQEEENQPKNMKRVENVIGHMKTVPITQRADQRKPPPMLTGIMQVDFFHPLAYGINYGIFGEEGTGKTALALDMVENIGRENEKHGDPKKAIHIVYAAIGKTTKKRERIEKVLKKVPFATMVYAANSEPLAMQYLAPFSALTIAEHVREQGKHVLIIYDDFSTHDQVYCALTNRLPVPMYSTTNVHARLLERTGMLKNGGSLTALCLSKRERSKSARIETVQLMAGYVDQSIWLDEKLRKAGIYPAVDAQSIVGKPPPRYGAAITRHLTATMAELMLQSDMTTFNYTFAAQMGVHLEDEDKILLDYATKLQLLLHQKKPISLAEQFLLLHAASNKDLLAEIPLKQLPSFITEFTAYVRDSKPELYRALTEACCCSSNPMPLHIITELDIVVRDVERAFRCTGGY